jgi:BirA family biotin operon repressor/biotin-[acetyl-CoA-carboxylase] ligase
MGREKVIELLRGRPEGYVSGEELSEALGMTRAGVWKVIEGLRADGYGIEAKKSSGYRLLSSPDVLTEAEIAPLVSGRIMGRRLVCLESVDSTNNCAKKLALSGAPDGTAVVSDCQTGGRGRMERPFQSPAGKGIYLSVIMKPELPPAEILPVTAMGAVAVCSAIEKACGARPGIKWTNDVVLNGKKICGILTEMSVEGESGALQYVVMGIGVNVRQEPEDFDGDVRSMASSLMHELGRPVSRPALAAAMLNELDAVYGDIRRGDLSRALPAYRAACVNIGRDVRVVGSGRERTGRAVGIDDSFGLIVEAPDGGRFVVRSGEASVRGLYGYVE